MNEVYVAYFTSDEVAEVFGLYRNLQDAKDELFEYFDWDVDSQNFRQVLDDGDTVLFVHDDQPNYTLCIERMEVR